jgi:hypothetical protein
LQFAVDFVQPLALGLEVKDTPSRTHSVPGDR